MPIISPSPVFRWFVPAQSGTGLVPAAGYKAKWYSAGTATAKNIYDDHGTLYPSPSNVAVLNSEGYAPIRLGDGMYKLIVTDPNDVTVYTQDNIQGGGSFSSGIVATVANDLPGVNTSDYPFVYCMGYYAIGDGGHGFFWNATSGSSPDGGYIIASTQDGTKRWFRVPDESDHVRAASFGYIGTKSGNLTTQLTNAAAYCFGRGKRLLIGPGSTAKVGTSTVFQIYNVEIEFEATAVLTADTGVTTLQFPVTSKITGTEEPHWTGFTTVTFGSDLLVMPSPTFFGASTSIDNTTAFAKWIAASTGNSSFVLPPGSWPYTSPGTFPFPQKPMLLWGTIGSGGSAIPPGVYFPDGSRFRFGTLLFKDGQTFSSSASYVELTGALRASLGAIFGTSVNAGTDISASLQLFAGGNTTAGLNASTGGTFLFRAGKSTSYARVGGRYYTYLNAATAAGGNPYTTSGTSETNFNVANIYANTMTALGDKIVIESAGDMIAGGTQQDRYFRVLMGTPASEFANLKLYLSKSTSVAFWGSKWNLRVEIHYIDATHSLVKSSILCDTNGSTGSGAFLSNVDYQYVTHTSNPWTADHSINVTGQAIGSGSITQNIYSLDFYPAP